MLRDSFWCLGILLWTEWMFSSCFAVVLYSFCSCLDTKWNPIVDLLVCGFSLQCFYTVISSFPEPRWPHFLFTSGIWLNLLTEAFLTNGSRFHTLTATLTISSLAILSQSHEQWSPNSAKFICCTWTGSFKYWIQFFLLFGIVGMSLDAQVFW